MSGFAFKLVPIVSTGRGAFTGGKRFWPIRCIAGSLITSDLSIHANHIAKCPTSLSAEACFFSDTNNGRHNWIDGWLLFIYFI